MSYTLEKNTNDRSEENSLDMNISNRQSINILDLPDELLRAIFNKLHTVDIFYSLVNVNQRFDRLSLDFLYIRELDFIVKESNIYNSTTYIHILDKIYEKILPRINDKIKKLTVDPFCIERILDTIHYPKLNSLSLVNYQPEMFVEHLSKENIFCINNQITDLFVDVHCETGGSYRLSTPNMFKIKSLTGENCLSSTVTKLTINVNTLNDCVYLLNQCFESLSTLIIHIYSIEHLSLTLNNKKALNLKCFSLSSNIYTFDYDKQIVPLLRQMVNLERLTLFLSVLRIASTYIDGNQLYNEVLRYMPQLNQFIFNIHTQVSVQYRSIKLDLPSNDDIRNSFIRRGFQSFDVCADDKFTEDISNCHVYSLPYEFENFRYLNNSFHGGKFDKVRKLLMEDERPFEYKLFKIISQDFPFLQRLRISNYKSQKDNSDHSSTLITFNCLFELGVACAHPDYAIQFLSDKNTRLTCLTDLLICYNTLEMVTNYFTDDTMRLNCAKIKTLTTYSSLASSQDFYSYFPSL